jgi:uncharacterized damage-inducible protein DinB
MIEHVDRFVDYFNSIRRRTINYIRTVPNDRLDWSPQEGEFTCADIVRHLAAAEKMFVGAVVERRWIYSGHTGGPESSLDELVARLEASHTEAMNSLRVLDDEELHDERPTLNGPNVQAWRLLMAMVEHEVHHRSQLAMYLALMGVKPPHIYGLGVEDVIALATG